MRIRSNPKRMFLTLLLTVWLASCAVNPVTGEPELMLLSEEREIALGREIDKQVIQQYGIYDDPELTSYVNGFCQKLAEISHRPHLPYQCKVMDSPVVNAFAVPGGYVYFTRGILAYLNNEAELMGVMGHELGHITARHSAQQYSRAQVAQVGLGLGMVVADVPSFAGNLAQLGVQMLFLKFSRDNERQSDDLGVEYASKLGYDAKQMANFFRTLDRMRPSSDKGSLPAWFLTHPDPSERNETVSLRAEQWQDKLNLKNAKIKRNEYLRRIDGLVFGENPRQGFVENSVFYHPDLRFEFPVPPNWTLVNTAAAVRMISPSKDAVILFAVSSKGSPKEVAVQFAQNTRARVIESSATSVNGLLAHRMLVEIRSQQQTLVVMSYFIEKNGKVYVLHGVSSPNRFRQYSSVFQTTMQQFKRLTDPRKLAVEPERVHLRSAPRGGSVATVLRSLGVSEENLEKMALLNGKILQDRISANTLLKIVPR